MFCSEYAGEARHSEGINVFGCNLRSAGGSCFLSVLCLHRALHCHLSRLPGEVSHCSNRKTSMIILSCVSASGVSRVLSDPFSFPRGQYLQKPYIFFFSCLCGILRCELFALLFQKYRHCPWSGFLVGALLKQGVPSLNFPPTLSSVEIFSFFFLDIRPSYQLGKYM